jgi:hypothetical protein
MFPAPISAVPPVADSVDVIFSPELPEGWAAQWCQAATGICYQGNQTIRLASGVLDTLKVDLIPSFGGSGMGWTELTVRSHSDSLDYAKCTYALFAGVPVPNAAFLINCSDNIRRLSSGTFTDFRTPMRNTSGSNDSLIVAMTSTLPPGWSTQFCQRSTGTCYFSHGILPMPPGQPDTLAVDFIMSGSTGYGVADISLRSKGNPTVVTYCHYQVFLNMGTTGVPEAQVVESVETRTWGEPNPFTSSTTLRLRTESDGPASLSIFGADGRLIRDLTGLQLKPGVAQVKWDGLGQDGETVPSGVYFYRFHTVEGVTRGMIVRTR